MSELSDLIVFLVLDVSHAADAANIFWTASVAVTHAEDMFEVQSSKMVNYYNLVGSALDKLSSSHLVYGKLLQSCWFSS